MNTHPVHPVDTNNPHPVVLDAINRILALAENKMTFGQCCLLWHHGYRDRIPAKVRPFVKSYMESRITQRQSKKKPYGHLVIHSSPELGARAGKVRKLRSAP